MGYDRHPCLEQGRFCERAKQEMWTSPPEGDECASCHYNPDPKVRDFAHTYAKGLKMCLEHITTLPEACTCHLHSGGDAGASGYPTMGHAPGCVAGLAAHALTLPETLVQEPIVEPVRPDADAALMLVHQAVGLLLHKGHSLPGITRLLMSELLDRERDAAQERPEDAFLDGDGPLVLAMTRNDGLKMGVLVSPSPDQPGKWRLTFFDEDGFSGDTTRTTRPECIALAIREGYRDTNRNLLRELDKTQRFRDGNSRRWN